MRFWKRDDGVTSIGTLDPALPQTIEQCTKTFGGVWKELKDTLDIEFRDAYLGENSYDLNQCKDITKERLRRERKPLLEAQDIKFMQAQEAGSDTSAIVTEKNRLRDITKKVDSCKNTDELKALKCEAS